MSTSVLERRLPVGILGATGLVGQQLIARLADHPWFEVTWVAASQRSEGQRFGDRPWRIRARCPDGAARLTLSSVDGEDAPALLFSALDSGVAGAVEAAWAARGRLVVSNARNHRLDPLVPLVIPEVNANALELIPAQQRARGWRGAIVTNPNCSTVFVAMVLAALRPFHPSRVMVTTLQALSGAGHPGVAALDALGNVIPFIDGEEEKIERETMKLLGREDLIVSAQATRVPVADGHTALMSIALDAQPPLEDVANALRHFAGAAEVAALPSAPARPIAIADGCDRPQPKLDALAGDGMTVTCGRLRRCPVLGYKLVALGHNTIRGAAGAAILNAELLFARGTTVASIAPRSAAHVTS